jgi:O-antigen ligase
MDNIFFRLRYILFSVPLWGLLLTLPYGRTNGVSIICLSLGLVISIGCFHYTKRVLPILVCWGGFALWYSLSVLWTKNPELVWLGLRKEILYPFVGFTTAYIIVASQLLRSYKWVVGIILFSGFCFALTVVFYFHHGFNIIWIQRWSQHQYPGVGDSSTQLLLFSVMGLLCFKLNFCRVIKWSVFSIYQVLVIYAILLTENRMGVLCLVIFLLLIITFVSLRLSLKMKVFLFIVASLLLFFGIYKSFSIKSKYKGEMIDVIVKVGENDPRITMWKYYLSKINNHALLGYGGGYMNLRDSFHDYPEIFDRTSGVSKMHAHNVLLNKQLQLGSIGLILFLLLYYFVARHFVSQNDCLLRFIGFSLIIVFFSKSMTDDFFIRDNIILFWVFIGALLASSENEIWT